MLDPASSIQIANLEAQLHDREAKRRYHAGQDAAKAQRAAIREEQEKARAAKKAMNAATNRRGYRETLTRPFAEFFAFAFATRTTPYKL